MAKTDSYTTIKRFYSWETQESQIYYLLLFGGVGSDLEARRIWQALWQTSQPPANQRARKTANCSAELQRQRGLRLASQAESGGVIDEPSGRLLCHSGPSFRRVFLVSDKVTTSWNRRKKRTNVNKWKRGKGGRFGWKGTETETAHSALLMNQLCNCLNDAVFWRNSPLLQILQLINCLLHHSWISRFAVTKDVSVCTSLMWLSYKMSRMTFELMTSLIWRSHTFVWKKSELRFTYIPLRLPLTVQICCSFTATK